MTVSWLHSLACHALGLDGRWLKWPQLIELNSVSHKRLERDMELNQTNIREDSFPSPKLYIHHGRCFWLPILCQYSGIPCRKGLGKSINSWDTLDFMLFFWVCVLLHIDWEYWAEQNYMGSCWDLYKRVEEKKWNPTPSIFLNSTFIFDSLPLVCFDCYLFTLFIGATAVIDFSHSCHIFTIWAEIVYLLCIF